MSQLDAAHARGALPRGRRASRFAQYMVYGTPWPLSEDDYLCVYDAEAQEPRHLLDRPLRQPGTDLPRPGDLVRQPDPAAGAARAAGDPAIRPCRRPRALAAAGGGRAGHDRRDERLRQRFPPGRPGRKIAALRVIQVLPKTTPPAQRAADRRGRADQRPGRAGHRAGRGRRQRLFRGPGRQGDLLPGPRRAGWRSSRCARGPTSIPASG